MNRYFHIIHQLSIYANLTVITQADSNQIDLARLDYPNLNKVEFLSLNQIELPFMFNCMPRKIAHAIYSRYLTRSFFKSANEVLLKFYHPTIELLKKQQFDFIVFENLASLDLAKAIKSQIPNVKQVYDAHNFDTEIAKKQFEQGKISKRSFSQVKSAEDSLSESIDMLWTCSQRDADLFNLANKDKISFVEVIPNGTEIRPNVEQKKANQIPEILFVGSLDYYPNEEGLVWFLREVLCEIDIELVFNIVGSGNCSNLLFELIKSNDKVNLIGFVKSLDRNYLNAEIVIIPILSGSGTRLKVIEAMNFQKAIVSTSKGVEGIEITDQIKIENDPTAMATVITSLLKNEVERIELGLKAKQLAEQSFDWNVIGEKIKKSILE